MTAQEFPRLTPDRDRAIVLVTGPASSGKSEVAEHMAHCATCPVTYIATAEDYPDDAEWQAKIARHQARRPAHWQTVHLPVALPAWLMTQSPAQHVYLIDALGTWVANSLDATPEQWQQQTTALQSAIATSAGHFVIVAEEVGWGLVPAYPTGRVFRDRLGRLVRQIGAIATHSYLVTSGYVLPLHAIGLPLSRLFPAPESAASR